MKSKIFFFYNIIVFCFVFTFGYDLFPMFAQSLIIKLGLIDIKSKILFEII